MNSVNLVISIITVILAVISFLISQRALKISNENFLLTHRPYFWAEDCVTVNERGIKMFQLDEVKVLLRNSPAKIMKASFSFVHESPTGARETVEEHIWDNVIRYPDQYPERKQGFPTFIQKRLSMEREKDEGKLLREVHIRYRWLASLREYSYLAVWEFDFELNYWKLIENDAD